VNYELLFKELATRSVRFALTGARGGFGRTLLAQARAVRGLRVAGLCDLDPEGTRAMLAELGYPGADSRVCANAGEARRAAEEGSIAVVRDPALLAGLPFDILVEATGQPEVGVQVAAAALRRGISVAMVSKETDSVVGPWLGRLAIEHGAVYTTADGDQPSALIGLVTWARTLGLEVVAAGKSSEHDYVYDAAAGSVTRLGISCPVPGFAEAWTLGPEVAGTMERRRALVQGMLVDGPPDYCEMNGVANSTGLLPARETLSYPLCRTPELADVFIPREEGGILDRPGVVDVFHCLRRPDEASFSGGTFIVVRCGDAAVWETLRRKGLVVSRNSRYACVYRPFNLMGVETPISLFSAVLHGRPSGAAAPSVRAVMVARAGRALDAGEVLRMGGHHHTIEGVLPRLVPAAGAGGRAPFYLAANRRLRQRVPAGADIPVEALDLDGSELYTAWLEQKRLFP